MGARRKGTSRSDRRRLETEHALALRLPAELDVLVVGGGPAGLSAAIAAAESGARTAVIERDVSCGRTILATGNGRCNLANVNLAPARYNDPAFVEAVCGPQWLDDIRDFFDAAGLAVAEESEGRLYPVSRQASSVRSVLLQRAARAGVMLACARELTSLRREGDAFVVRTSADDGTRTQTVILATGGGEERFHGDLGLAYRTPRGILCPISCKGFPLERLDGRRVRATLSLRRDNTTLASETGEVLFRPYGVSGIAAFNLSRLAQAGDALVLDLLPEVDEGRSSRLATHTLDGLLDPLVAEVLEDTCGSRRRALARARSLALEVVGLAQAERAQVRAGGLLTSQFAPGTLACTDMGNLFCCGEALDVDGPCGGFNLAWAWKSGLVAGGAAAQVARHARPRVR